MIASNEDSEVARSQALVRHLLGAEILAALAEPDTIEILLNPDGVIFHERLGRHQQPIGSLAYGDAMALASALAGTVKKKLTRESPWVETELVLDGSRVSVQVPPIVPAPTLSIRKHASAVFTLEELCSADEETGRQAVMHRAQADVIRQAVVEKKNILVVGGTGSGKTTLINAILAEIARCREHAGLVII
jgi:type IV secretion system protein VirB11